MKISIENFNGMLETTTYLTFIAKNIDFNEVFPKLYTMYMHIWDFQTKVVLLELFELHFKQNLSISENI